MAERGTRHHMIVVADVEGFGDPRRTKPHQRAVRDGLYKVMQAALTAAGVAWKDCYHEDRGDAVFVLAPAEVDKAVFVEALPPLLVTRLRVHNDTHPDAQRIRLRLALHAGEIHYDDHGVTSTSLTLAFRLNDAVPLKAALAASPGVLAVIASDWFFDDVVRHTPGAAPTTWRPVAVEVKEVATTGWITLPDHPYPTDPTPTASPAGSSPTGLPSRRSSGVVPRQLPAAVRDFTGRAEHLAALDALLPPELGQHDLAEQTGQSVVITAVDGTGGIGKTTLAVHWAHRVQHRFPDGTLHVNLRGYGPGTPAAPGEALDGFLRALDTPPRKIPGDVEAQAALFRSLVAGKRMLIVLDNAHRPEQIRPLLPGSAGCMVLVTSRDSLTGLVVTDAAHRLTLDLLTSPEALDLVTSIIGPQHAATEAVAVGELIRLCARLPLALRIAASRVAAHSYLTVADVVAELADDQGRLDALSQSDDERAAVRAVFDWSYEKLPPEQARLFRRLGLHPGPDLSLSAAAALAEQAPADTRPLLAALTDAHLIEPTVGGRYRFHDLLRAYAAGQAQHHDTFDTRAHALESLLTWYIHTARAAHRELFPEPMRLLPIPAAVPAHPDPISDFDHALTWLTTERINLSAALHHVADRQLDRYTVLLTYACVFAGATGNQQDWLDTVNVGFVAACRVGNQELEARFLMFRAEGAMRLRRWAEAGADLDRAATMARELDNADLQVWALNGRGLLLRQQGQFEDALRYFGEALPLCRGIDTGRWEAVVEGNLSAAYSGLGQYRQALDHGQRGLRLRRQAGDHAGEPVAVTHLALAQQGLAEHETAITLCQEAITIGHRVALHPDGNIAEPLNVLATSLHHLGHTSEAIACWQEAATIYDDCGLTHNAAEVRERLEAAQLKNHL